MPDGSLHLSMYIYNCCFLNLYSIFVRDHHGKPNFREFNFFLVRYPCNYVNGGILKQELYSFDQPVYENATEFKIYLMSIGDYNT